MWSRAVSVLCLTLAIACGSAERPVDPAGATLPEPWKAMNLPVGAGKAEVTEDGGVHVAYTGGVGGSAGEQLATWRAALEASGWTVDGEPRRAGPILVQELDRDGKTVTLMVTPTKDRVDVQVELE